MKAVTNITEHKKYRSKFPSVDLPKSFLIAKGVLGLPDVGVPNGFYFRRIKGGTEIFMRFENRFVFNASVAYSINPKSFAEARIWAKNFSLRHGIFFVELKGKFRDIHRL